MKKKLIWGTIALTVIILVGGITFFISRLFSINDIVLDDKPTAEQQAILDMEFETSATIGKVETTGEFYMYLHEMANTLIIAEDGQIWGLKPITRGNIEVMTKAFEDLSIYDKEIKATLERWAMQDFSHGVEDHNYVWDYYLNGTVGKAIKLRK